MVFPFPAQQPLPSIYQSQFGGMAGFNPPLVPQFQQVPPPPRGQSVPTPGRQYPPSNGPYGPPPPVISSSSRRQQTGQYPVAVPSQNYEQGSGHRSKSKSFFSNGKNMTHFPLLNSGKKHRKGRSSSPNGAGDQGLYSDHEQPSKGQHESSEAHQGHSRSQSPPGATHSKHESVAGTDQQQQQSQASEGINSETVHGSVARSEQEQAAGGSLRHKSGSKKKKHHRRDRYSNYETSPPVQGVPIEINSNIPFQQPYVVQQPYFGEYQNELPPQLKVILSFYCSLLIENNHDSILTGSSSTTLRWL